MNLEILTDVAVQGQIVAFSIAATQLIKPSITGNRAMLLPLISVVFGLVFAFILIYIPEEFYPLLTTLSTLVTGTGGVGLAQELVKKEKIVEIEPKEPLHT